MAKQQPDLAAIAEAAKAAAEGQNDISEDQRFERLESRLAEIEPLLEQLQRNSEIGPKLAEYISDLRSEQKFFNIARPAVGVTALLTIVFVLFLLSFAIFHADSPLLKSPPAVVAAVVIGLVSSVALLISGFVKGVFRSTVERHADGFLPPALEKAAELMAKVSGKSG